MVGVMDTSVKPQASLVLPAVSTPPLLFNSAMLIWEINASFKDLELLHSEIYVGIYFILGSNYLQSSDNELNLSVSYSGSPFITNMYNINFIEIIGMNNLCCLIVWNKNEW